MFAKVLNYPNMYIYSVKIWTWNALLSLPCKITHCIIATSSSTVKGNYKNSTAEDGKFLFSEKPNKISPKILTYFELWVKKVPANDEKAFSI